MPVNINNWDKIVFSNESNRTLQYYLPTNPYIGEEHIILDGYGNASVSNIIINGNGKNINGFSTFTINVDNGYVNVNYNGVEWKIVGQTSQTETETVVSSLSNIILLNNQESVFVNLLSNSSTVYLPAIPELGQKHTIKDMYGNAFTNNLTINGNGKNVETFFGVILSTNILNQNFDCITYEFNGVHWSIV